MLIRYEQSTATDEEVQGVFNCFGDAVGVFQKKVSGRVDTEFQARELATFLQNYFLQDVAISDDLLRQIMNVKVVLVGGSSQTISRQELATLVTMLRGLGPIAIEATPYVKVYLGNWTPNPLANFEDSVQYFEKSSATFLKVVEELSTLLFQGKEYDLRNIIPLCKSLQASLNANWSWLSQVQAAMPLLQNIKGILTGTDVNVVQPSEWRQLGVVGAHGYIEYLRFNYFGNSKALGSAPLVYFANSFGGIFSFLGDLVQSKPSQELTKAELLQLLTSLNQLFPNLNFTEPFVDQFMILKQVVFGGSAEKWTPADFAAAQSKLSVYGSILPNIWKFNKFYSLRWNPNSLSESDSQSYFAEAESNLVNVVTVLSGGLSSGYDLNNLSVFAQGLYDLLNEPRLKFQWALTLRDSVPLLISAKAILLGNNSSQIEKSDWNPLLVSLSDLYHRYLYFNYFIQARSVYEGPGLDSLDQWSIQIQTSLQSILHKQSLRVPATPPSISYQRLSHFILALLPQVKEENLQLALQALFQKLLIDPQIRFAGYTSTGFTQVNLQYIVSEYNLWSGLQHEANVLIPSSEGLILGSDLLKKYQASPSLAGHVDMASTVAGTPSLELDSAGEKLYLSSNPHGYSRTAIGMANLSRELARIIEAGYIGTQSRLSAGSGILSDEANAAYLDFQPMLADLGLVKSSNKNFVKSRFVEAELFPPTTTGGPALTIGVLAQEIEILLSGLKIQSKASSFLQDQCVLQKAENSLDDVVSVSCSIGVLLDHIDELIPQLPEALVYLQTLPRVDQVNLLTQYLETGGWVNKGNDTALRSEMDLISFVLQYAEIVMLRYDMDHAGFLNFSDAKKAYPNFASLVGSVVIKSTKINLDFVNKAAFYYILRTQKFPTKGFSDILPDILAVITNSKIDIHVPRNKLGQILGVIAAAEAPAPSLLTPNFLSPVDSEPDFNPPDPDWFQRMQTQLATPSAN